MKSATECDTVERMRRIKDPAELIRRLGGVTKVAKLFGYHHGAVSNWLTRGLPAETYPLLRDAALELDPPCEVDEGMWNWFDEKAS